MVPPPGLEKRSLRLLILGGGEGKCIQFIIVTNASFVFLHGLFFSSLCLQYFVPLRKKPFTNVKLF